MQVNNATEISNAASIEAEQISQTASEIDSVVSNSPEEGLASSSALSEANSGPDSSASNLYSTEAANDLPSGDTGLADTRGDALTHELAREVFDEAVLSFDAYKEPATATDRSEAINDLVRDMGYTELSQEQLQALMPAGQEVKLSDDATGFNAKVYQGADGNVTVSYTGSESDNWDDIREDWLVSDVGQAFFNVPESYQQASDLAAQMKLAFGDDVMLTGHSLGGGMANYAAIDNNLDYNVFNAAGLAQHTVDELGDKVNAYNRTGNVINDAYDPLTNFGGKFNDETWGTNATHVGEDNLVFMNNDTFNWWDFANAGKRTDAHMMETALPALANAAGYGEYFA